MDTVGVVDRVVTSGSLMDTVGRENEGGRRGEGEE